MTLFEAESGVVISISGSRAVVRLTGTDVCQHCAVNIFCRTNSTDTNEVTVQNEIGANVGSHVRLSEKGNLLLLLAVLQFGVPLTGLLLGILFARFFQISIDSFPDELSMSLFGFFGLILGGAITWFCLKRKAVNISPAFRIISVDPADQTSV
ncbi:SoxR reducing system RseC family protein [bacterium]|nr:SoxR reducing system RseC family protein [bacterium]